MSGATDPINLVNPFFYSFRQPWAKNPEMYSNPVGISDCWELMLGGICLSSWTAFFVELPWPQEKGVGAAGELPLLHVKDTANNGKNGPSHKNIGPMITKNKSDNL